MFMGRFAPWWLRGVSNGRAFFGIGTEQWAYEDLSSLASVNWPVFFDHDPKVSHVLLSQL